MSRMRIHQKRVRLHQCEAIRVQEMDRGILQREAQDDDVRFCQKRVQRTVLCSRRRGIGFRPMVVVEQDAAVKSAQTLGDSATDGAHADDADRAVLDRQAVEARCPAAKIAAAHMEIGGADVTGEADYEPHGEFRCRRGQMVRHDAKPDTACRAGINVNVVVAFERRGDDGKPGRPRQEGGVDAIRHEDHGRLR